MVTAYSAMAAACTPLEVVSATWRAAKMGVIVQRVHPRHAQLRPGEPRGTREIPGGLPA